MTLSRLALAGSTLAFAWPAHAQSTPDRDSNIVVTGQRSSLTAPDAAEAEADIRRTPGAVEVIPDTAFKNTPVQHIKDVLGYAPGVITQVRMGDDARISIRGSGLSRAYGIRGIAVLLDGVPMNTSDGLVDFFEVDPSAYRYVEVYRGGNALRYGANALGGAINLVTPTGRDASPLDARIDLGSFGYLKAQASTGGATGELDYFATVSTQRSEGYREHSEGDAVRANANLGYRIAPNAETRFYVTAATTNQRIPGEVTKADALANPRAANPGWIAQDQQRNVDSLRIANKTSVSLGQSALAVGAFYNWRHVKHPIFQWLDYTVDDYGAFARLEDDRSLGSMRNNLVIGASLHNGTLDTEQFVNLPGAVKGALAASMIDKSENLAVYAEDSLSVLPNLALVAGVQYLHAVRDRRDRFLSDGDQSGRRTFELWSPKFGMVFDVRPDAQVFANVSRSGEVPSYDANVIAAPVDLLPQRATTYEVGTRGRAGGIGWDLSLYRSDLRNELQCLTNPATPWALCTIVNAPRTMHQGIEAGLDGAIPLGAGNSLGFLAAYTLSDFHFEDDSAYGDNELPGVPRHYLRAEALFRHASGFYAGPNVEWSPASYFADNANTLEVDSFALINAKAGYEIGDGVSAYIEGRNLTGKRYISTVAIAGTATADAAIFNPGTGRAVFAGMRYSW